MLTLPQSVKIARSKESEEKLYAQAITWIQRNGPRTGVHASDLLDPRQSYYKKKHGEQLTPGLALTFMIGHVLHAFMICAVEGQPFSFESDQGSRYSKELDLYYSVDVLKRGVPREIKSSRRFYPPRSIDDLANYIEQLLIYMAAEKKTVGQLWILFLNAKDSNGRTSPRIYCYTVSVSKADLRKYAQQVKDTRAKLTTAIKDGKPDALPLCREWKCGKKECAYWKECKPEGRYRIAREKWSRHGRG